MFVFLFVVAIVVADFITAAAVAAVVLTAFVPQQDIIEEHKDTMDVNSPRDLIDTYLAARGDEPAFGAADDGEGEGGGGWGLFESKEGGVRLRRRRKG